MESQSFSTFLRISGDSERMLGRFGLLILVLLGGCTQDPLPVAPGGPGDPDGSPEQSEGTWYNRTFEISSYGVGADTSTGWLEIYRHYDGNCVVISGDGQEVFQVLGRAYAIENLTPVAEWRLHVGPLINESNMTGGNLPLNRSWEGPMILVPNSPQQAINVFVVPARGTTFSVGNQMGLEIAVQSTEPRELNYGIGTCF